MNELYLPDNDTTQNTINVIPEQKDMNNPSDILNSTYNEHDHKIMLIDESNNRKNAKCKECGKTTNMKCIGCRGIHLCNP